MKILIADDHSVLRQGLKMILAEEYAEAQFGEAGNTSQAIDALMRGPWDILLLDINMPGRGGLEVLEEAGRTHPAMPVLVFSSTPEDQLAVRVLKAGAVGYLNKQALAEELVIAMEKVLASGHYVSPTLAERLAADLGRSEKPPHDALSNREFEVFHLMALGKSIKEIAADLSLSPKTVSTFRGRIFSKLHFGNDVEMANYVHEHHLFGFGRKTL